MVEAGADERLVTVFGGSGFLGRHVVRALLKRDWRVRVAVRRPDLAGHLQPLARVGQVHAVQANLRYPQSVQHAVAGASAVVNLVGILAEGGRQTFDRIQVEGARAVAEAAAAAGVQTLVQMSAIGARRGSAARYADSKARGEEAVLGAFAGATIVRPSVVFGSDDRFFNQFAGLARMLPALPLIGGGMTRFQPVFAGDVAEVVARGAEGRLKPGATYELGGQRVMTLREIMEYVLEITGRRRMLVPVPFPLAEIQGSLLGMLPNPLLTRDQVEMLKDDCVVSEAAKTAGLTLEGLGIEPDTVEAVVPQYLWRFRRTGQFETSRLA